MCKRTFHPLILSEKKVYFEYVLREAFERKFHQSIMWKVKYVYSDIRIDVDLPQ
jgi:hypothetical protein